MASAGLHQSPNLLAFFTTMESRGLPIVREQPKLDLETYIANYTGRARHDRLLTVGKSSVHLCLDALKMAFREASEGNDIGRYREAWELLHLASPNDADATFDEALVEERKAAIKSETHRLEKELKGYKNNLIKESIRIGHRDLGLHLESIGDLNGAAESYAKMRPDASTQSHITEVGKLTINVLVQKGDWPSVLANVSKVMSSLPDNDEVKQMQPYHKMVTGIAYIASDKLYDAARSLTEASDPNLLAPYTHIATANDVAVYGGLTALATMDRAELKSRVLDNSSFRSYLEYEPHIRKALTMFVNGRYASCLEILESYRPDYLLDLYLQKHVDTIYSRIRSKCIVQYFLPFSVVTLDSLEQSFARPGESLEKELISMIRSGALKARINTDDKLLVQESSDARAEMQTKVLEMAKEYRQEALERIRRMSIAAADLEVKGSRKGGAGGMGPGRAWEDDSRRQPLSGDMPMT